MRLLLLRHAHAGERDAARWPDDRLRPITDKGRRRQARMSRLIRAAGPRPDLVLTSPWTRAAQTAEVTVRELRLARRAVPASALAAAPDLGALRAAVAAALAAAGVAPAGATVALVGHSPWMEQLAALLLTGDPDGLGIDFPKSGAMALELDELVPGGATLRFFLRPKQARR